MKKSLLFLVMLFAVVTVSAQVKFETGDFKSLVAQAEKEDKLIFIDAFAEWCGPCKYMSSNIFPLKEVGDYLNKNFVNAKIDMEKGEGPAIGRKFNVRGYPTFLILDSNGKEITRIVGASRSGDEFIDKIQEALSKQ